MTMEFQHDYYVPCLLPFHSVDNSSSTASLDYWDNPHTHFFKTNHTVLSPNNATINIRHYNCNGHVLIGDPPLDRDMQFNETALMTVVVLGVLFCIAAVGNLTVFITLFRNRHRRSRVNLFILHLSMADLFVTFVMIPIELGWHVTVSWQAGDVACRICMFFRAFGFYLSSFVLVTISLDRYFAVKHPLSLSDADRRGKLMLVLAWVFSTAASIPQSVIFHVERHPHFEWFTQCVTFNFFPNKNHELAYNLFNVMAVYVVPLAVIIVAYSLILCEITKKTRESREQVSLCNSDGGRRRTENGDMRRSGIGRIERARTRTLKMTIVIVSVFIVCWTPYFVMSAWWWFDEESASKIHPKVQKGLFLFAVSNSCVNPIVYGMFATVFRRTVGERWCLCFQHIRLRLRSSSNGGVGGGSRSRKYYCYDCAHMAEMERIRDRKAQSTPQSVKLHLHKHSY